MIKQSKWTDRSKTMAISLYKLYTRNCGQIVENVVITPKSFFTPKMDQDKIAERFGRVIRPTLSNSL